MIYSDCRLWFRKDEALQTCGGLGCWLRTNRQSWRSVHIANLKNHPVRIGRLLRGVRYWVKLPISVAPIPCVSHFKNNFGSSLDRIFSPCASIVPLLIEQHVPNLKTPPPALYPPISQFLVLFMQFHHARCGLLGTIIYHNHNYPLLCLFVDFAYGHALADPRWCCVRGLNKFPCSLNKFISINGSPGQINRIAFNFRPVD